MADDVLGGGLLLAIDVGTSGLRVYLIDLVGRPVRRLEAAIPIHNPAPGWFELDPEAVWQTAADMSRAVLQDAPEPVLGVGVSL